MPPGYGFVGDEGLDGGEEGNAFARSFSRARVLERKRGPDCVNPVNQQK
jgi:hypothetical protein